VVILQVKSAQFNR